MRRGPERARRRRVAPFCAVAVLAATCAITGCAVQPVEPWQRGALARWDMQLDPDPLDAAMREHVGYSKESAAGRLAPAGGGCGCN